MSSYLKKLGFVTWGVLIALTISKVFLTSLPITWIEVSLGLLGGFIAADLLSGLIHWFCDNHFSPTTPWIGPAIIAPFRDHHTDLQSIVRNDFFERNLSNVLAAILPLFVGLTWENPTLIVFSLSLSFFIAATNQIHYWTHTKDLPSIVRWLQKSRIILSPDHHAKHHASGREAYCITNGFLDRLIDRFRLFDLTYRLAPIIVISMAGIGLIAWFPESLSSRELIKIREMILPGSPQVGNFSLSLDWVVLSLVIFGIPFQILEFYRGNRNAPSMRQGLVADAGLFLVSHLLLDLTSWLIVWPSSQVSFTFALPLPILVQIPLLFVVAEFFQYWSHRAFHTIPILRRFHKVHHSIKELDWLASSRMHLGEIIIARSMIMTPILLLGFDIFAIRIWLVFIAFQGVMNHANIGSYTKKLEGIFVSPKFHHWHHSKSHGNGHNFGVGLVLWDRVFNTAKMANGFPTDYGLPEKLEQPDGAWLLWPFSFKETKVGLMFLSMVALLPIFSWSPFPFSSLWLLVWLVPALLIADFLTGVVHWAFDQHIPPSTPLIGPVAQEFRDHHLVHSTGIADNAIETMERMVPVVALPMLGLAFLAKDFTLVSSFLMMMAFLSSIAPYCHKLAHDAHRSQFVRLLQRLKIILPPKTHAKHHQKTQSQAYCIYNGWCNPLLDRINFFGRLDRLIERRR
jgi:lathosterol oxidase